MAFGCAAGWKSVKFQGLHSWNGHRRISLITVNSGACVAGQVDYVLSINSAWNYMSGAVVWNFKCFLYHISRATATSGVSRIPIYLPLSSFLAHDIKHKWALSIPKRVFCNQIECFPPFSASSCDSKVRGRILLWWLDTVLRIYFSQNHLYFLQKLHIFYRNFTNT